MVDDEFRTRNILAITDYNKLLTFRGQWPMDLVQRSWLHSTIAGFLLVPLQPAISAAVGDRTNHTCNLVAISARTINQECFQAEISKIADFRINFGR